MSNCSHASCLDVAPWPVKNICRQKPLSSFSWSNETTAQGWLLSRILLAWSGPKQYSVPLWFAFTEHWFYSVHWARHHGKYKGNISSNLLGNTKHRYWNIIYFLLNFERETLMWNISVREKCQSAASTWVPTGDGTRNLGSKPATLCCMGWCSNQRSHTARDTVNN